MSTTLSEERTPGGDQARPSPLTRLQHLLHAQATIGPAVVLLVAVVVFAVLSPRVLTPGNVSLILLVSLITGVKSGVGEQPSFV